MTMLQPTRPRAPAIDRIRGAFMSLVDQIAKRAATSAEAHRMRRELDQLLDMPDHIYRDIGLTHDDVREARRNVRSYNAAARRAP